MFLRSPNEVVFGEMNLNPSLKRLPQKSYSDCKLTGKNESQTHEETNYHVQEPAEIIISGPEKY